MKCADCNQTARFNQERCTRCEGVHTGRMARAELRDEGQKLLFRLDHKSSHDQVAALRWLIQRTLEQLE